MKMSRIFFTAVAAAALLLFSCETVKSGVMEQPVPEGWHSNYPFVFVHGLSGWGHYDAQNKILPYWGMKNGSLMKQLRKEGFLAYDASVDPQGSAWDRACELYAQLSGTVTDYGAEHSARCGHERFGRDFSADPLLPRWSEETKINLVGHSFGGVTVRLLAYLMAEGSDAERAVTPADELSPLFAGGHASWIYSVSAVAAPHNGTSAYHVPDEGSGTRSRMQKAMHRSTPSMKDGRAEFDHAAYDMHIPNAAEINRWLKTVPSLYYFSFPCSATQEAADGTQEPVPGLMESMFVGSSRLIGHFEGTSPDGIMLGKEWQENDGLVNTISARAPDFAPSQEFPEPASPDQLSTGIWYIMPTWRGDHMSLQGGFSIRNDITAFYVTHLDMINRLGAGGD